MGRVTRAFAEFAESHGLPASVRRGVLVALDELVANALTHGARPGGPGVEVTVEGTLESDRLVVMVRDGGEPFDPLAQAPPDTTLALEDREPGGLGLHLVREMMDEVCYSRRGDQNEVVLVKQLGTPHGAEPPGESA